MGATKTLNVYLPADLYREIAREARDTGKTKGAVVRDHLASEWPAAVTGASIADLFGVANDLPPDLSSRKDNEVPGYGEDRVR